MEATELIGLDWAAFRAGISRRQLDYWIRAGIYAPSVPGKGQGSRIKIDMADLPKLRLLGQITNQMGSPGVDGRILRMVLDNYDEGMLLFDGFSLEWETDDEP